MFFFLILSAPPALWFIVSNYLVHSPPPSSCHQQVVNKGVDVMCSNPLAPVLGLVYTHSAAWLPWKQKLEKMSPSFVRVYLRVLLLSCFFCSYLLPPMHQTPYALPLDVFRGQHGVSLFLLLIPCQCNQQPGCYPATD